MAFKIIIKSINTDSFNINGSTPYNKGVYKIVVEFNKVGLINARTRKKLIAPTHFVNWFKNNGETFKTIKELVDYLQEYIEKKGTVEKTKVLSNEQLILDGINKNTKLLESILEKL